MKTKIRSSYLALAFLGLLNTGLALAGGTTAGGGGTTLPQKIDPKRIIEISQLDSGFAIKSFFIAKKDLYDTLSVEEQNKSPYSKLFDHEKNIFSVLDKASINLKMSSACLDFDDLEKEGSVNTENEGDICISPFLMSKKLDKYNVTPETVGLIVHELTHLLGTDEEEATLIQLDAIDAYFGIDLKKERETFAYNNQANLGIFIFNIKNVQNKNVIWTNTTFSGLSDLTTTYRDIFDQNEKFKYLSFNERIALEKFVISKLDYINENYSTSEPTEIRKELKTVETYLEKVYKQTNDLINFQLKSSIQ